MSRSHNNEQDDFELIHGRGNIYQDFGLMLMLAASVTHRRHNGKSGKIEKKVIW